MEDKVRLKAISDLFGGPAKLAKAMRLPRSSISRRISGDIPIKDRDKYNISLLVDEKVKNLSALNWERE